MDRCMNHYHNEDYTAALKEMVVLLEENKDDMSVMNKYIPYFNEMLESNKLEMDEKTVEYIRKLAVDGNSHAQNAIAYIYELGLHVNKSHYIAVDWYQRSVDQGNVPAMCNLSYMHKLGRGGLRVDVQEYYRLNRFAADLGFSFSQNAVGLAHERGTGCAKDHVEAHKWYRLSAENGCPAAQYNTGVTLSVGRGCVKNEKEALEWYKESAKNGYTTAILALGKLYEDGEVVEKSYKEAAKWYRQAADKWDPDAKENLKSVFTKMIDDEIEFFEVVTRYSEHQILKVKLESVPNPFQSVQNQKKQV